jgi:hypothetical protein
VATADATGTLLLYKAGVHQHPNVAEPRLRRDRERLGQFGDPQILEPREDHAPDRIGKGTEDQIELFVIRRQIGHPVPRYTHECTQHGDWIKPTDKRSGAVAKSFAKLPASGKTGRKREP